MLPVAHAGTRELQQGKLPSLRVILTQRPTRGKVHDQKRKVVLYSPIAKRQQMRMAKSKELLQFCEKVSLLTSLWREQVQHPYQDGMAVL